MVLTDGNNTKNIEAEKTAISFKAVSGGNKMNKTIMAG
jgi:hypothetical protein